MKNIKYNLCTILPDGSEVLNGVEMPWSEANEAIAKAEAKDGKYTVTDDGKPDPADIPSQLDQIEAQVTYTAMMTGTLMDGGGAHG